MSSECAGIFKYIGLEVEQDSENIKITRKKYIDKIMPMKVPGRGIDDTMNPDEKWQLKSLPSQMNWTASHSRPDMGYDICEIHTSIKDTTVRDVIKANKVLRKLKMDNFKLKFPELGTLNQSEVIYFTGPSYGNLKGKVSQGYYVIFLNCTNRNHAPIA